jgi:hypothetical protein
MQSQSEDFLLLDVINHREGMLLRQEILKRLKTQVQLYLGKESSDLRRYALAYKKSIERQGWKASSKAELYQNLLKVDVVFGGDFHAFAQSQKVHLRALREITTQRKVILALECVESKHQKIVDRYIAGKIGEEAFLDQVGWGKSWGFSWAQYKPLFEIVKKNGGRCLALNYSEKKRSGKLLDKRDLHAAQIIADAQNSKKQNELIYVVYGDLHIAKEHLPTLTLKKTKRALKYVILYLNPEKIYFQLARQNLEHKINVIKFSKNEYCLVESPPWVKWQSYLLFLEENIDQEIPSDHSQLDYTEHVGALLKVISGDLKIPFDFDSTVHSFYDKDFMDILQEKVGKKEYSFLKKMVANDLSFFYPAQKAAFLSRSTVNHAAHLAAKILHARLSLRKKIIYNLPSEFPVLIWIEALAFALSKMINPHRKAFSLGDLKKQLAAFSPKDRGEEALKIALDQKMKDLILVYGSPLERGEDFRPKDQISYYKAAKILGGMLGESIFLSFRAGRLSRKKLLMWLKKPIEQGDFDIFYIQVLKELDKMDLGEIR